MNTRIITTLSVSLIVILVSILGFYITLDVSPQIAYARLFIDLGMAVGLIAVILGLYKEKSLPVEGILQGIILLKQGKYEARVNSENLGGLSPIALAINDLARVLGENHQRQENIKKSLREELLPKFKAKDYQAEPHHSIHPELGPVVPLPKISILPKAENKISNAPLSNILVNSEPPKANSIIFDQNIEELFKNFLQVQKENDLEEVEYSVFLKTVNRSKEVLMAEYNCSQILFDVVFENNEVALQPKIVR